MNAIDLIKNNRFVRGIYYSLTRTFGYRRTRFGYLANNVVFTPPIDIVNPKNVFIYSDTSIGDCYISALNAKFVVGKGCAIARGLNVQTGNHARLVGIYVGEVTEETKPEGYDKDVIIEDDVWIGSNVTLLSGVRIGRGSTVAAGAVVNKSMPPYCVCGGVPARVIKFYWTIDQIIEHEAKLYPENERYSMEQLSEIFKQYEK